MKRMHASRQDETLDHVAEMASGLGIGHHFSDGLYAKEIHIRAGHYVVGHTSTSTTIFRFWARARSTW